MTEHHHNDFTRIDSGEELGVIGVGAVGGAGAGGGGPGFPITLRLVRIRIDVPVLAGVRVRGSVGRRERDAGGHEQGREQHGR